MTVALGGVVIRVLVRPRRSAATFALLLTFVLGGAVACGSDDAVSLDSGIDGWVVVEDSWAAFMRFTEDADGRLSGQMQYAAAQMLEIDTDTLAFTGQRTGEDVSVTVDGGWWGTNTLTGTVTADALRLLMPARDGRLVTVTLTPGDVDRYNDAVANMQERATAERQAAADDEARAREEAALGNALEDAGRDVYWEVDTLNAHLEAAVSAIEDASDELARVEEALAELEQTARTASGDQYGKDEIRFAYDSVMFANDAVHSVLDVAVSSLEAAADERGQLTAAIDELEQQLQNALDYWGSEPPGERSTALADARSALSGGERRLGTSSGDMDDLHQRIEDLRQTGDGLLQQAQAVAEQHGVDVDE